MGKYKPAERKSLTIEKAPADSRPQNFQISLADFDSSQKFASAFKDWQSVGLLSKAMETLHGYCKRPLHEQIDGDKFTVYKSFPQAEETKFTYPAHVPEDAAWARIHVTGVAVLIGHIVGNTFYLVFLDKTHKFWLTKKARGK